MKPMQKSVFLLDGAIGVGKSALGWSVAEKLGFGFVDGDELSGPGRWFCSSLTTSRKIVEASEEALSRHAGGIVAYPLRCTSWLFFLRTFERTGISCHCIGLVADSGAIESRDRRLSPGECARSREMISQGYGQRHFSDLILRTDDAGFEATFERLAERVRQLCAGL